MKRSLRTTVAAAMAAISLGVLAMGVRPAAASTDSSLVSEASAMRRARVTSVGIELEYPSHWIRMGFTVAEAKAIRKGLAKTNPSLAKAVSYLDVKDSTENTKFRALDLAAQLRDGVGGVVAVQVIHSPLPPIDVFQDTFVAAFEKAGADVLSVHEATVSHRNALRSDLRMTVNQIDGTPVTLRVTNLMIEHGFTTVMVSVGVPDDDHADATIEPILASVHRI